jgi:hypothetical protein
MVELNVLLAIFVFCILSFFDIIVYNEEVLLTLCFLCFIFYCFQTLSGQVAEMFETRASQFEQNLLITYNGTKNLVISEFNTHIKLLNLMTNFKLLSKSLLNGIAVLFTFFEWTIVSVYFQTAIAKLNELAIFNQGFSTHYQKSCVSQLLYSIILTKTSNKLKMLNTTSVSKTGINFLKFLI